MTVQHFFRENYKWLIGIIIAVSAGIIVPIYLHKRDGNSENKKSGHLSGNWRLNFMTAQPDEQPRQWHNFDCKIIQKIKEIRGTLSGVTSGHLKGNIKKENFSGSIIFEWDQEWWKSVKLIFDKSFQSASGTAIYIDVINNETHYYSIRLIRVD